MNAAFLYTKYNIKQQIENHNHNDNHAPTFAKFESVNCHIKTQNLRIYGLQNLRLISDMGFLNWCLQRLEYKDDKTIATN